MDTLAGKRNAGVPDAQPRTVQTLGYTLDCLLVVQTAFELPQLYFLSRAIFGQQPDLESVFTNYLRIVRHLALPLLTWRRFSMARSFENPALMLEGSTAKVSRDRLAILKQDVGDKCGLLTFICYQFEFLLCFSIIMVIVYLVPNERATFGVMATLTRDPVLTELMTLVAYMIAMSVIAPFYTAAGFGVYLSRRILLECWDIEVNFKRLASRLATARAVQCIAVITLCLATMGLPGSAKATTPEKVRTIVKTIAADKAFGRVERHYVWRFKATPKESSDNLSFLEPIFRFLGDVLEWVAQLLHSIVPFLEALAWFALIMTLLLVVRKFEPWQKWQTLQRKDNDESGRRPAPVMGLDLSWDSLPADVAAEVKRLQQHGEARAALSLLYRGTLWRLAKRRNLKIDESCTEVECVRLVQDARPSAEAAYFEQLTRCWCRLAYAHEAPSPRQLEMLSGQWIQYYEAEDD